MTQHPRHSKRRKPLLVDDSLNKAFTVKYVIYALFGLSGVLVGIPSITIVAGEWASTLLAAIVAVSSTLAAIASWHSIKGGKWVGRELYATIIAVVFLGVYSVTLIVLALQGVGNRSNLAIIALAFLVFPIWKILFILRNSKP